jgi:WD40 repeat protein/serine/threonine protein kinase
MPESSALSSYQILATLPWPPAGTVFEARVGDEPVVLAKLGHDADVVARARRSLRLQHPAIARSVGLVDLDDGPALVQVLPGGRPLGATPHSPEEMVELVDQLLGALEYAHGLGVTHGDLRSEDLVVDAGRVQIRRFGFARPSRPPAPRYDLTALGACLAPLIQDQQLRTLLASAVGDAAALRRRLRSLRTSDSVETVKGQQLRTPEAFAPTQARSHSLTSAAHVTPESLVGRRLGDFVVRGKLAEGGLGLVYRAQQASLGDREVVIKVPFSRKGDWSRLSERFNEEAQLASRLDHPYAAHIYAFGIEPDGLMWIAMELVKGTPLNEYIRQCGAMAPARAAAFVERLAQVIHHAHELQIVHRDIKPSNVMVLQRSGRLLPKLLDFGIARMVDPGTSIAGLGTDVARGAVRVGLTMEGAVMGSPLYMAPEQWKNASEVGPAADIYALGVLTYEILTGQPPFMGETMADVWAAHMKLPVPSLGPSFPESLNAVLARAMAKRSEERFATALDFAAALGAAIGVAAEAAPLPRVPEAARTAMLDHGPAPIADTLAGLESARNVHQARAALDQVVDASAQWLGVVALAARSRTGPAPGGDSEAALSLLRELGRRLLEPAEWTRLARELVRPFASLAETHPVAELVAFLVAEPNALDELLARRRDRRDVSEEAVRNALVADVATLGSLLEALAFFQHYRVVLMRDGVPEVWVGVRRGSRQELKLRGGAEFGKAALVDADAVPLLRLDPLVQAAVPMPGSPEEMFLFSGTSGGLARMVAPTHGFQISLPEVHEWLRREILVADKGESARAETGERPPYRGLSAFTADDADNFVGRERECESFLNRLRVQSLLAVVGRSGSGKSSFIQAGVIPHLPAGFSAVTMRPGASPIATLDARLLHGAGGASILLFVDQFEEVFTLCRDADERQRFAKRLVELAADESERIRVVLTLRDDFLLRAQQLDVLRDRLGPALVLLGAPGSEDLERILVEPARRRGYTFDDPELPQRMVREVGDQPGALPMLSFAAAQLWEHRDRHFNKLLVRAYDGMGGVTGALVGHAEATLEAMTAGERGLVRDIFRSLVTEEGTRDVVAKKELLETLGDPTRAGSALEKLIASRLLVASEGAQGEEQIEVAHETLLQSWPRLVEWRREDASGTRVRRQLRQAAHEWDRHGRPRGRLWRDDALAEFRVWQKRDGRGLSALDTEFASASLAEDARAVRRRRVGIAIGFALLAAISVVLWTMNRRAQRATAETRKQLVESYLEQARTKLLAGRRWEALAELLAAQKMGAGGASVDLMRGLARVPARALEHRIRVNRARTWDVHYSPDGKLLLSTGEDGAALWDAESGRLHARLEGHEGTVRDGVFAPDGKRLATIGYDRTVRLWDGATGAPQRVLRGHSSHVWCLAWRGDGARLATADESGRVLIWDPDSDVPEQTFETGSVIHACRYGGGRLALASQAGDVLLVDGGRLHKLGRHQDSVRDVNFSSNGQQLVSASFDKTARIWDVQSQRLLTELRGAGAGLLSATFSPDAQLVAGTARDGTARLWEVASGNLRSTLSGHQGAVWYAEFDRSGRRLLTAADDGSARLWDVETGVVLAVLEGHTKLVMRARFSPDGSHAATSSYDGTVALWRTAPAHLEKYLDGYRSVSMLPFVVGDAGTGIAMAHPDGTRVWSLSPPSLVAVLPPSDRVAIARTHVVTYDDRTPKASVWAVPSKRLEREITTSAPITAAAVDDQFVALAEADGWVRLQDHEGHPRYAIDAGAPGAGMLTLLGGGRWLMLTASGSVRIFDGERELATLAGPPPSNWVNSVQYQRSPDGESLAITGGSEAAVVQLLGTPRLVRLAGHQAPVLNARFDRSGRRLVTCSEDGTAGIWDVARGQLVRRLTPKSQYLADAIFDANGEIVIGTDGQGGIEFFDSETGHLLGVIDGPGRASLSIFGSTKQLATVNRWAGLSVYRVEPDRDDLAAIEHDLACKAPTAAEGGACPP